MKRLTLCADDYGLSPAVSSAIIELIDMGRLNATSVMVNEITNEEVFALKGKSVQIGLHLTLTKSVKPLILNNFDALPFLMLKALTGLLSKQIEAEIDAQYNKFITLFGHAPHYIDGHQHCHLFKPMRRKLFTLMAPNAWIRQTKGAGVGFKAKIISALSTKLISEANALNIKTNAAFSGSYHFIKDADFRALFQTFLQNQPSGLLIMVHPGRIDELLKLRDPIHKERVIELNYLKSNAFLEDLKTANFNLY